jgi:hypothetical protein
MRKIFPILALVLTLTGCNTVFADSPRIITLSQGEKDKAVALLERRQAIWVKRKQLDAKYNADVHRLDEEMSGVDVDAMQLCFDLKKAHKIAPNLTYELDEMNAQLVKR